MSVSDQTVKGFLIVSLILLLSYAVFASFVHKNRETFTDNDARFETYQTIIQAYSDILDRTPNPDELARYMDKIQSGEITKDKLRISLQSSAEYRRMEKTQSNVFYGELPGNIADRQIREKINDLYQSVYIEVLDEQMYPFYKSKYIQFDLDDSKFIRYLNDQKLLDAGLHPSKSQEPESRPAQAAYGDDAKLVPNAHLNTPGSSDVTTGQDADSSVVTQQGASACGTRDNAVKLEGQIQCAKVESNKQAYADEINRRNNDELNANCHRTSQYLNADDDGVLIPEYRWTVPMVRPPICLTTRDEDPSPYPEKYALVSGTSLADSNKATMGSMLMTNSSISQIDKCILAKS